MKFVFEKVFGVFLLVYNEKFVVVYVVKVFEVFDGEVVLFYEEDMRYKIVGD